MSIAITGIGTARPAGRLGQADAAAMATQRCAATERQARLMPGLYRMTTVAERASSLLAPHADGSTDATSSDWFFTPRDGGGALERGPTTADRMRRYLDLAPPLAIDAARAALLDADAGPDSITHLVVVTCTGFGSPGVELRLIEALGLRRTVSRTQVGFMGCHGAFNGLRVAAAFAAAEPDARVLVVCVELCSLHFQYGWHDERVVANALFTDGAAAVVVEGRRPKSKVQGPKSKHPTPRSPTLDFGLWTLDSFASCVMPDSTDEMSWHIGDHGFEMTLASTVPATVATRLRPWLDAWLAGHGLGVEAIGGWAIHPGGPRIVSAVAECLGLNEAQIADSRAVLRECGNMSSATVLFILDRFRRGAAAGPVVAMGFGPGLVAEAALLTASPITSPRPRDRRRTDRP